MTAGVTDLSNQAATVGETEQVPQALDVALDRCGDQNPFTADDRLEHRQAEAQKHIRSQEPDTRIAEMAAAEPEPIIKTEPPNRVADQSSALAEPHTPSQTGFPAAVERMPQATAPGAKKAAIGQDSLAEPIVTPVGQESRSAVYVFRYEGELWDLGFADQRVMIRDSVGLRYIAELLRAPRKEIEALALAPRPADGEILQIISGAIEAVDPQTIQQVQCALDEKRSHLSSLHDSKNWAVKGELEEQIRKLEEYIKKAQRSQRVARRAGGSVERARLAVTNAIQRALAKIRAVHPKMADHLEQSIRTGSVLIYLPQELPDWEF
jgi:hypothetical protein